MFYRKRTTYELGKKKRIVEFDGKDYTEVYMLDVRC